jgi:uncharacterized membrane protein
MSRPARPALGRDLLRWRRRSPSLAERVLRLLPPGRRRARSRLSAPAVAAAGATAVGAAAAGALAARRATRRTPQMVRRAVTVNRPVNEVFAFWEDVTNVPLFMTHLEVEPLDERRSRWHAKGIGGRTVSWEAEVTDRQPERLIAWRTLEPAAVPHTGRVEFTPAPGGRGTEVRLSVTYQPPAGQVGVALARLTGQEPDQQVREDLRRLKRVLESGQVVTVEGQPSARGPLGRAAAAIDRWARTGGR